jgi:hypothetical protein
VPPKRVLAGRTGGIAVDAVHNLLFVNSRNAMLIFDRTASGDDKPKAVIEGPKSGMSNMSSIQVYPPKGWIIAGAIGGGVGAWSINDNGDVPPRWRIPVKQITDFVAQAIALDPAHKEVIFSASAQITLGARPSNGLMNTVITFRWPEIF